MKTTIEHLGERAESLRNNHDLGNLQRLYGTGRQTGHSELVESMSVTPDGRRAVSGSRDKTVRVWDLASGQCLWTLTGHGRGVNSVSVTPDGRRAVSGSSDATLRVWDLASGQCLKTLTRYTDAVTSVRVTPDGRGAVSGSVDTTLRLWDLASEQCVRTLTGHRAQVTSVRVMPDGRRAVSGSCDKTVRVWDLISGQCLRTLTGHARDVTSVRVTPDGRRAVSRSEDKTMRVWDLDNGQCLWTLSGHTDRVTNMSVTPDGRRAVSGSQDKTVRVWDLECGHCLRTLTAHSDSIASVRVTPDGRRAVSGSEDKTVRVWDLDSGQCLGVYLGSAPFSSLALNGTGNVICAGTDTGEVLFLELHGVPSGSAILTADNPEQARCPVCGQEFAPPPAIVAAIQDQSTIHNPHSEILCPCLHCQHPLQFNPVFAAGEDYAEVLRRGLEQSRCEKGDDHDETLAHLAALAAHFEQLGQPEAARPFAAERNRLAEARIRRAPVIAALEDDFGPGYLEEW